MPPRLSPTDPTAADRDEDHDGMGREVRRTLAELSPWAVSIAAHVLLVVLALFLVWSTVLHEEDEPWDGEVAIHDAPDIIPANVESEQPSDEPAPQRSAPTVLDQPDPQPILRNPGLMQPLAIPPALPDGRPNRYTPDGAGDGPETSILGPAGRSTVFVIDASGSLIDTFPLVVNELKQMLGKLAGAERDRAARAGGRNRPYAYAVVFFRDGEVLTQDRRGLRTADRDAVNRSTGWLDLVTPGGSTSPLPAIEQALAYSPDTIIILSDNITGHGVYELNADDLVERVLDLRGDRRITINTVQFLYPDPLTAIGQKGTLERLAEETGGAYRFVTDQELNLR